MPPRLIPSPEESHAGQGGRAALSLVLVPLVLTFGLVTLAGHPAPAQTAHALSPEDAARVAPFLAPPQDFTAPQPYETMSGGRMTAEGPAARGKSAFALPAPDLARDGMAGLDFELGAALFAKLWVAAPSTTRASDGLGPLYNARSCLQCHPGNGRGGPPGPDGEAAAGLVLRLSTAGAPAPSEITGWLGLPPDPLLGRQLQDHAVPGVPAEGRIAVRWHEETITLSGGETVRLRRPDWRIEGAPEDPSRRISPRLAQPMVGMGLLAAIPDSEILRRADPGDRDGDGISGRVSLLPAPEGDGAVRPGRFGWKAGEATLAAQVASAFHLDLGISSPALPQGHGDCTPRQTACRSAPSGQEPGIRDGTEIDARALALTTAHLGDLAVPARRDAADPAVLRGKAVFWQAGCASCHVPAQVTARDPARPDRSFQLIWPHSDLLLHDMGEDLADHRPEGLATGREWRTPPLWGIGLTAIVGGTHAGGAHYLHDGRARSLLEAILWHGGEGLPARQRVVTMPPGDRADLIRYLESL